MNRSSNFDLSAIVFYASWQLSSHSDALHNELQASLYWELYLQSCVIWPCFNHIWIYLTFISANFHYFCPSSKHNLIKRILKVCVKRWEDYQRNTFLFDLSCCYKSYHNRTHLQTNIIKTTSFMNIWRKLDPKDYEGDAEWTLLDHWRGSLPQALIPIKHPFSLIYLCITSLSELTRTTNQSLQCQT